MALLCEEDFDHEFSLLGAGPLFKGTQFDGIDGDVDGGEGGLFEGEEGAIG